MTLEFGEVLRALVAGQVRFIIIGGIAGAIHGSARATYDLDVLYEAGTRQTPRS